MRFFASVTLVVSTLVSLASATNHSVIVGQNNQLAFEPKTLTGVQTGDFVSFRFVSKNHTVTQSTFNVPCVVKESGVDSGYTPVAADAVAFPEWTIQIDNTTAPLWFFCKQGAHCKAGMVFAINPTADKSFDAFLATAQGTAPSVIVTTSATATGVISNPETTTGSGATTVGEITENPTVTNIGSATAGNDALGLSAQTASSLLLVAVSVIVAQAL